jgi:hypothetical protein
MQKMWHLRAACWVSKPTCAQVHVRVQAPTHTHPPTHSHGLMHKHTLTKACARTHTHTHTRTEICNILLIFHGKNGFVNAAQYNYVIRTLSVLPCSVQVLSERCTRYFQSGFTSHSINSAILVFPRSFGFFPHACNGGSVFVFLVFASM